LFHARELMQYTSCGAAIVWLASLIYMIFFYN
jgi:hypothetical protein